MIETVSDGGFLSLGQSTARRIARQAAERNRFGRTLLVHGPAGAGKDAFVDDVLALAFCTDAEAARRPCNACRGCRDARARVHPDLLVGSPEAWRAARSTGESIVAAARRWLLEAAGSPVTADRRMVVIERADGANEQTQNALLKTLEEPGDRHAFILVADEPERLLPTIRSRCQPLRIGPVPREELVSHLIDRERLPADQAESIARIAGGLSGTAAAYVRQSGLLDWRRRVQGELLDLLERGRADRFGAVQDLLGDTARLGISGAPDREGEETSKPGAAQRRAALLLTDVWLALTRDLLVAGGGRPGLAPSGELASSLDVLAGRIGAEKLVLMIGRLERIHEALHQNAAPKLALEAAMLTWPMLPRSDDR